MHPPISRRKSQIQESAPVMKFQLQQMVRLEGMEVRKDNVCELDVWRVSRLSFRWKNKIMLELCRCNLKTNHHNQISSDEVKKSQTLWTIHWKYHFVMINEAFWLICVLSISDDSFQYKTTWMKFFMIEVNKFKSLGYIMHHT